MPTTRHQAALQRGEKGSHSPSRTGKKIVGEAIQDRKHARKRDTEAAGIDSKPQSKRARAGLNLDDGLEQEKPPMGAGSSGRPKVAYKTGTIERGHIYFFYRPKVEVEEVQSIDQVKNMHMLLIPRPPEAAASLGEPQKQTDPTKTEEAEMSVLARGSDAVPAPATRQTSKQYYRLVTIGKKKLPNPEHSTGTGKRKETFWATVTSVGENLNQVVDGLGPRTYETKTRGTRHEGAARLVARGGYAIVNTDAETPSQRETHLGYNISHPPASEMGNVQASLGIYSSSSFVLQVKNPHAPNTAPGMGHTKKPEYPKWIMTDIFGAGQGTRRRQSYGLKFASVETPELLDHVGAQLILIAAREGEQGLETSLGEGRGEGPHNSPERVRILLPELFDQHLQRQNIKKLVLD